MRVAITAAVVLGLAACGQSYSGQAAGVVPAQSTDAALVCLIKAAEANGYRVARVDSGGGTGQANMRQIMSQAEARSGDAEEYYQGNELRIETSAVTNGAVKATVTPFFIIVTRTAAGPNTALYPGKDDAAATATTVMAACASQAAAPKATSK
jgi:hypothetical protein